jgi:hypothetical protein
MSKHSSPLARRGFLAALALLLLPSPSQFLVNAQSSASVKHTVYISDAGADDEDTVVDDGDTIEFCPKTPDVTFVIIFTKSPFEKGDLMFTEHGCGSPKKAVLPPHDHARAYDYFLAASNKFFDPHVIIMPGKKLQGSK